MRWSKRNLRPGICSSKAPFCSHQLVISPTHQQVGLQKGDSQVSPRKKSRSSIINLNKFVIFSRDTKIKNGGNQTWKELKWVLSLSTYKLATFLLLPWYLTWHTIWSIQNKISPGPINPAKPHQKKVRAAASSSPMALRLRPSCRAKNLQWIGKNCLRVHGDRMMLQMNIANGDGDSDSDDDDNEDFGED